MTRHLYKIIRNTFVDFAIEILDNLTWVSAQARAATRRRRRRREFLGPWTAWTALLRNL